MERAGYFSNVDCGGINEVRFRTIRYGGTGKWTVALKWGEMRAFRVGQVLIDPPVLLAPMEDVTNLAFRLVTKRIANPGLMFTEFVSAMAIHLSVRKTFGKLRVHPEEKPLGIQIFGNIPDVMAEAGRACEAMGANLVDINMGCWVPKVCRAGSGAALLKDPDLALKVVSAVVRAVKVPVSVKVRAGWDHDHFTALELAQRFEGCGVQMITLHARFAKQGFEGEADWRLLEKMRKAIRIPLVGNGDVRDASDALRMFKETGVDGVMVGRAAIGNPWKLREIIEGVRGKEPSFPPSVVEKVEAALEYVRLAIHYAHEADGGRESSEEIERRAIRSARFVLPHFMKGEPGSAFLRAQLVRAERYAEIEELLRGFAVKTVGRMFARAGV